MPTRPKPERYLEHGSYTCYKNGDGLQYPIVECQDCGALISNKTLHDRFHDGV